MKTNTQWIAKWSQGRSDALVWTVRGVTALGIYITSPGSRSPGHLLTPATFARDYVPAPQATK